MSNSICETFPGICEKSHLRGPRPVRLLRAANDNLLHGNWSSFDTSLPTVSPGGDGSPAIRFGSAISILGLVVITAHAEIAAAADVLFGALDELLTKVPTILW